MHFQLHLSILLFYFNKKKILTTDRHANLNALFKATLLASISIFGIEYACAIKKTSIIFIAINASLKKTL
jgi:hypothetical protein